MERGPWAIVYLPDAGSHEWARRPIAGLSVLLRAVMAAVSAGARRVGLPRALADDLLLGRIQRHPLLAARVVSLEADPDRTPGAGPFLLLPANAVVESRSLRALLQAAERGAAVALEESKGGPSPVLVVSGEQARRLWAPLSAGRPVGEELESWVREGRTTLVPGGGSFVPVTDPSSRRQAEALLYSMLGTEADSVVDRVINRRCSRRLTHLLVRLPVSPNQVSFAGLGLGLAGAWAFWFATPLSALLGLVLYMLAVVTDHSDGEIARLTFQESVIGRWLDVSVDTVITVLVVMGMAATATAVGGPLMLLAGAVAGSGIIVSAVFANFFPPRANRAAGLGRVLRGTGNRDMLYLVLLFFVLSLWKVQWLLPPLIGLLAVGSHVYWLTCLVQRKLAAP
ncbi:MAG: CDP-alcohol phosphatidyltransferase family protein [Candidatus Methylomirabilia bacterium]